MRNAYRRLCYWIHTHPETAIEMAYVSGLCMWVCQMWWLWLTKGAQ